MSEWICMGCFTQNSEEKCYCDKCYKIRCNQFCWYCNKCNIENTLIDCECGTKYSGITQSTTEPPNTSQNINMPSLQINVRTDLVDLNNNTIGDSENIENIENILNDRISSLLSTFTNNLNENNETVETVETENVHPFLNLNEMNISLNNINTTINENNNTTENISPDEIDLNNISDSEQAWKCNICKEYNDNSNAICSYCKCLAGSNNENYEWLCTSCGTLETNNVCESCNVISYRELRSRLSTTRISRIIQFISTTLSEELFKDIEFRIKKEEVEKIKQEKYNDSHKEIDTECSICMESFNNDETVYIMDKCCNKILHKDCLDMWFQKSYKCPLCRNEFEHEIIK
jgi:hypothetical protein